MYYTEPEPEPFPPLIRRLLIAAAIAVAAVYLSVYVGLPALFALHLGWHPLPGTRIGCALHKRYHAGTGVASSAQLGLETACLVATVHGRSRTITDPRRIEAIRAWVDQRSDLWLENIITVSEPRETLIHLRPCQAPGDGLMIEVYVSDDWLGYTPSKAYQRPLCRDEWRQLLAVVGE